MYQTLSLVLGVLYQIFPFFFFLIKKSKIYFDVFGSPRAENWWSFCSRKLRQYSQISGKCPWHEQWLPIDLQRHFCYQICVIPILPLQIMGISLTFWLLYWWQHANAMELQSETLFLGVGLMDRFLSRGYFINERNLQLLGISCITLATRIEENQPYNRCMRSCFSGLLSHVLIYFIFGERDSLKVFCGNGSIFRSPAFIWNLGLLTDYSCRCGLKIDLVQI